jgi:hypothetical protein
MQDKVSLVPRTTMFALPSANILRLLQCRDHSTMPSAIILGVVNSFDKGTWHTKLHRDTAKNNKPNKFKSQGSDRVSVYFILARTQVRSFLEVQPQPYPTSSKIRRRVKQGDVHCHGIPFRGSEDP